MKISVALYRGATSGEGLRMEARPMGEAFPEDELRGQEERLKEEEGPAHPITRRETGGQRRANPEYVLLIQIPLTPKEACADHGGR